ncbi:hypothetical protein B9Z55_026292 [Caenorhabditis nigoni]|uniref:Uncharacterized protein n=1 Tax=Caenorhabditis nigoni TaxID=1611254 RepID=A0A2G5T253_9PELO|nr:hypothetical protein B9Z55_026292 [Caenorhabditis nigoni]
MKKRCQTPGISKYKQKGEFLQKRCIQLRESWSWRILASIVETLDSGSNSIGQNTDEELLSSRRGHRLATPVVNIFANQLGNGIASCSIG